MTKPAKRGFLPDASGQAGYYGEPGQVLGHPSYLTATATTAAKLSFHKAE
jgi:hypothetical protein